MLYLVTIASRAFAATLKIGPASAILLPIQTRHLERTVAPPYLHRPSTTRGVSGHTHFCSLSSDSCRISASGRSGSRGAQRPRSGHRRWPLTQLPGSRIMSAAGGRGVPGGSGIQLFGPWAWRPLPGGKGLRAAVAAGGRRVGQPALPWPAGHSLVSRRHDDGLGVPPPAGGMRPLSLTRPSARGPCGPVASDDSGAAGAGRGCSPSVNMAVMRARARRAAAAGSPVSVQAAAKASSPRSLRMWQARRMILRASDRAARLPFLRSLTCA